MYACVYIPDFSVQAVMRGDPTLCGRAVAIVDGTAPLLHVVALNGPARAAGIELGMTTAQVMQLGSAAPAKVEIRRRSPAQEAATHATLLDCAYTVSPRLEDTTTDTVLLDLAGLKRALGSLEKSATKLAQQAFGLGLEVRIAVAPNPDAALHAAYGFPGITLIAPGEEDERLGRLPVEVLAPLPEVLETLHRWGVRTFRALAALPTGQLSERLGQEGVRLQTLARGGALRPLVPTQTALHFEEVMELEYSVTELEPLSFILGRLLNQLCARLAARSLATNELTLQLGLEAHELDVAVGSDTGVREIRKSEMGTRDSKTATRFEDNGAPGLHPAQEGASFEIKIQIPKSKIEAREPRTSSSESRVLRLPVPMRDSKVFLKLLQLNLQADPPPAPILKVTIAGNPVKPHVAQGGLFLPLSPDPEKLEVVLARIAGVVGKENVGSPELVDTHRPDAFRMQCFVGGPIRDRGSEIRGRENNKTGAQDPGSGIRGIENFGLKTADWESSIDGQPSATNQSSISNQQSSIVSRTRQSRIPNPKSKIATPESRLLVALRVFRPAVPAQVEVRAERPARIFSACGARGEIVSASGPWRTSGDWWTDNAWERDEWDISVVSCKKHPQTALYRIYRDLSSGNWCVQGVYD